MSDAGQLKRVETRLLQTVGVLSQPRHLQRLQWALLLICVVWALNSLAKLFWVVWPTPASSPSEGSIINPAVAVSPPGAAREPITLDGAIGLGLFGDPSANLEPEALVTTAGGDNPREGIEDGARETRLALKLTGIVASTEDGLGSAVIEAKNAEATYAVGDELPVDGGVKLAKVMPTQVVLDNSGTYELLKLFEDSALSRLAEQSRAAEEPALVPIAEPAAAAVSTAPTVSTPAQAVSASPKVSASEASQIASALRDQLYDEPQSLAQLVNVAAVRGDEGLKGYRVSPGKNPEAFRQLGFEAGDVITAVNGLSLSDPSNTVRLYQMMRDATDATFEIERGGGVTSLSVSLP